jgi:hypothetical protein
MKDFPLPFKLSDAVSQPRHGTKAVEAVWQNVSEFLWSTILPPFGGL